MRQSKSFGSSVLYQLHLSFQSATNLLTSLMFPTLLPQPVKVALTKLTKTFSTDQNKLKSQK